MKVKFNNSFKTELAKVDGTIILDHCELAKIEISNLQQETGSFGGIEKPIECIQDNQQLKIVITDVDTSISTNAIAFYTEDSDSVAFLIYDLNDGSLEDIILSEERNIFEIPLPDGSISEITSNENSKDTEFLESYGQLPGGDLFTIGSGDKTVYKDTYYKYFRVELTKNPLDRIYLDASGKLITSVYTYREYSGLTISCDNLNKMMKVPTRFNLPETGGSIQIYGEANYVEYSCIDGIFTEISRGTEQISGIPGAKIVYISGLNSYGFDTTEDSIDNIFTIDNLSHRIDFRSKPSGTYIPEATFGLEVSWYDPQVGKVVTISSSNKIKLTQRDKNYEWLVESGTNFREPYNNIGEAYVYLLTAQQGSSVEFSIKTNFPKQLDSISEVTIEKSDVISELFDFEVTLSSNTTGFTINYVTINIKVTTKKTNDSTTLWAPIVDNVSKLLETKISCKDYYNVFYFIQQPNIVDSLKLTDQSGNGVEKIYFGRSQSVSDSYNIIATGTTDNEKNYWSIINYPSSYSGYSISTNLKYGILGSDNFNISIPVSLISESAQPIVFPEIRIARVKESDKEVDLSTTTDWRVLVDLATISIPFSKQGQDITLETINSSSLRLDGLGIYYITLKSNCQFTLTTASEKYVFLDTGTTTYTSPSYSSSTIYTTTQRWTIGIKLVSITSQTSENLDPITITATADGNTKTLSIPVYQNLVSPSIKKIKQDGSDYNTVGYWKLLTSEPENPRYDAWVKTTVTSTVTVSNYTELDSYAKDQIIYPTIGETYNTGSIVYDITTGICYTPTGTTSRWTETIDLTNWKTVVVGVSGNFYQLYYFDLENNLPGVYEKVGYHVDCRVKKYRIESDRSVSYYEYYILERDINWNILESTTILEKYIGTSIDETSYEQVSLDECNARIRCNFISGNYNSRVIYRIIKEKYANTLDEVRIDYSVSSIHEIFPEVDIFNLPNNGLRQKTKAGGRIVTIYRVKYTNGSTGEEDTCFAACTSSSVVSNYLTGLGTVDNAKSKLPTGITPTYYSCPSTLDYTGYISGLPIGSIVYYSYYDVDQTVVNDVAVVTGGWDFYKTSEQLLTGLGVSSESAISTVLSSFNDISQLGDIDIDGSSNIFCKIDNLIYYIGANYKISSKKVNKYVFLFGNTLNDSYKYNCRKNQVVSKSGNSIDVTTELVLDPVETSTQGYKFHNIGFSSRLTTTLNTEDLTTVLVTPIKNLTSNSRFDVIDSHIEYNIINGSSISSRFTVTDESGNETGKLLIGNTIGDTGVIYVNSKSPVSISQSGLIANQSIFSVSLDYILKVYTPLVNSDGSFVTPISAKALSSNNSTESRTKVLDSLTITSRVPSNYTSAGWIFARTSDDLINNFDLNSEILSRSVLDTVDELQLSGLAKKSYEGKLVRVRLSAESQDVYNATYLYATVPYYYYIKDSLVEGYKKYSYTDQELLDIFGQEKKRVEISQSGSYEVNFTPTTTEPDKISFYGDSLVYNLTSNDTILSDIHRIVLSGKKNCTVTLGDMINNGDGTYARPITMTIPTRLPGNGIISLSDSDLYASLPEEIETGFNITTAIWESYSYAAIKSKLGVTNNLEEALTELPITSDQFSSSLFTSYTVPTYTTIYSSDTYNKYIQVIAKTLDGKYVYNRTSWKRTGANERDYVNVSGAQKYFPGAKAGTIVKFNGSSSGMTVTQPTYYTAYLDWNIVDSLDDVFVDLDINGENSELVYKWKLETILSILGSTTINHEVDYDSYTTLEKLEEAHPAKHSEYGKTALIGNKRYRCSLNVSGTKTVEGETVEKISVENLITDFDTASTNTLNITDLPFRCFYCGNYKFTTDTKLVQSGVSINQESINYGIICDFSGQKQLYLPKQNNSQIINVSLSNESTEFTGFIGVYSLNNITNGTINNLTVSAPYNYTLDDVTEDPNFGIEFTENNDINENTIDIRFIYTEDTVDHIIDLGITQLSDAGIVDSYPTALYFKSNGLCMNGSSDIPEILEFSSNIQPNELGLTVKDSNGKELIDFDESYVSIVSDSGTLKVYRCMIKLKANRTLETLEDTYLTIGKNISGYVTERAKIPVYQGYCSVILFSPKAEDYIDSTYNFTNLTGRHWVIVETENELKDGLNLTNSELIFTDPIEESSLSDLILTTPLRSYYKLTNGKYAYLTTDYILSGDSFGTWTCPVSKTPSKNELTDGGLRSKFHVEIYAREYSISNGLVTLGSIRNYSTSSTVSGKINNITSDWELIDNSIPVTSSFLSYTSELVTSDSTGLTPFIENKYNVKNGSYQVLLQYKVTLSITLGYTESEEANSNWSSSYKKIPDYNFTLYFQKVN